MGEAHPAVECKYLACPWYKMKITQYDRNTCVATQVIASLAPSDQDVNIVITHKHHGHKGESVKESYCLLLDNDS